MNSVLKPVALGILALTISFSAKGQYMKYVRNAYNLVSEGSGGSIEEAKDDIDKAMTFEAAKTNSYTWLVRSMVYSSIFFKKGADEGIAKISAESGYTSGYSLMQFWKSSTISREDRETGVAQTVNAFSACYNESFAIAQNKDYTKLVQYYQVCLYLYDKLDTADANTLERQEVTKKSITEKLGIAAYSCTDVKLKIEVLQELVEGGSVSPVVVEALSKAYLENKDTVNAEATIRNAIKKAPGNNTLFQLLINYFVSIGREDLLFDDLNKQIELNPESKLYYARGVLYEGKKQYEKAAQDYKMAVSLDALNYDANYNLGRLILLYKPDPVRTKIINAKTADERQKANQELKDVYLEAKGYLETAAENTTGYNAYGAKELINIYKTLKNIALELGNKDEAQKYEDMIKALEASGSN